MDITVFLITYGILFIGEFITSVLFVIFDLGTPAIFGFAISWILIILANILIIRGKEAKDWLKALPMFHASLLIYNLSMIIDSALMI